MSDETRQSPTNTVSHEASPTDIALFLAGALHSVLAHFDELPLQENFDACGAGNRFALTLEKINGEASSALIIAGAHSMFEPLTSSHRPEGS